MLDVHLPLNEMVGDAVGVASSQLRAVTSCLALLQAITIHCVFME
jgi:hypothetical protein